MTPWRIVSWFAGSLLFILAFRYMPSWRECAVFIAAYIAVVVCNMRIGMGILGGAK